MSWRRREARGGRRQRRSRGGGERRGHGGLQELGLLGASARAGRRSSAGPGEEKVGEERRRGGAGTAWRGARVEGINGEEGADGVVRAGKGRGSCG